MDLQQEAARHMLQKIVLGEMSTCPFKLLGNLFSP